jgi:hypothetical protein
MISSVSAEYYDTASEYHGYRESGGFVPTLDKPSCPRCLVCQPDATFDAATLQHTASRLGSHTLQKAVLFCLVAFLWLVRSFRHS